MNPDEITVEDIFRNSLCEDPVCFDIALPVIILKIKVGGLEVESWPQDRI